MVIHEGFDVETLENDIAIIKWRKPLKFNKWVQPAYLPSADDRVSEGEMLRVSGFGATRPKQEDLDGYLRVVDVPVVDDTSCADAYSGTSDCIHTQLHKECFSNNQSFLLKADSF